MQHASKSTDIGTTAVEIRLKPPGNEASLVEHSEKVCEELGLARVPKSFISSMRQLGLQVQDAGVITTDNGMALFTKARLVNCVDELGQKIEGATMLQLDQISKNLGILAKAIASLSGKNFSAEPGSAKNPALPKKSFAPGQAAAFHLHYHQEKPA